jgi:hypothetical protein
MTTVAIAKSNYMPLKGHFDLIAAVVSLSFSMTCNTLAATGAIETKLKHPDSSAAHDSRSCER